MTSSVTSTIRFLNNGYTQLGDLSPGIKIAFVTGTTSNSQGGTVNLTIPSSIDVNKIIGMFGAVSWDGAGGGFPPGSHLLFMQGMVGTFIGTAVISKLITKLRILLTFSVNRL